MKKYTKDNLQKIVDSSLSVADVCRKLNMRPVGGNYKTLKKHFRIFDINTSHFTGQGWNVGKRYRDFGKKIPLEEILIKNSNYTSTNTLKKRLIKDGIKENRCEKCGLTEWNDEKLVMHLDHVNGDNLDNRLENLKMLCPNCHSQTKTYCMGNNKSSINDLRQKRFDIFNDTHVCVKEKKINFCKCGKEISKKATHCKSCASYNQKRKVENRPDKSTLLKMIEDTSFEAVGRKYGVTGKAVKKWLK